MTVMKTMTMTMANDNRDGDDLFRSRQV